MTKNKAPKGKAAGSRVSLAKDATPSLSLLDATSNAQDVSAASQLFGQAGAIEPPYAPEALTRLFEHSNSLRQNIDAYATNIDGFGHRFEALLDLDATDINQRLATAMYEARKRLFLRDPEAPPATTPTNDEVEEFKREIVAVMREERGKLERFFDQCCDQMSLSTLRRRTRQDMELLGNGYWEVLRNGAGEVSEFVYLPGYTMRLTALDKDSAPCVVKRRTSDFTFEVFEKQRRWRRFIQVVEGQSVFFKEFGDARIIGKKTGKVFASIADMQAARDGEATEVIHFKVHTSRSPYGIPRWIGNLPSVWGSRQSEEVNALYFDNKGVPPLAIMVSGGRLVDATIDSIKAHINGELKGKNNFHNILLLEAEATGGGGGTLDGSGGGSGAVKIDFKSLTDAQQKDGLFMAYDERNMDKVGMAFRLPRLLRGDIRDFNRASAEAALEFAEQQVFQPEREEFDFIINRQLMIELGARFWEFKSQGPTLSDPKELAEIIKLLMDANVLTPEEGRELAEGVFGKELKNIELPWTQQPMTMTLAGIPNQGTNPLTPWVGDPALGASAGFGDLDGDGADDGTGEVPEVTRTAFSAVITVNELRAAHKLPKKTLADGTPDPDGDMTIAEYQANLAARIAGNGNTANQAALQTLLTAKRRGSSSEVLARGLLKLRDDMRAAAQEAAFIDFEKQKLQTMRENGELTETVVKRMMGKARP